MFFPKKNLQFIFNRWAMSWRLIIIVIIIIIIIMFFFLFLLIWALLVVF